MQPEDQLACWRPLWCIAGKYEQQCQIQLHKAALSPMCSDCEAAQGTQGAELSNGLEGSGGKFAVERNDKLRGEQNLSVLLHTAARTMLNAENSQGESSESACSKCTFQT